MKKILFILTVLLGFSFKVYSQNYISKDRAIEDIDFFFDNAEQIHPNLFFKISKIELDKHINSLKNDIKDRISINEFSKKMRALVNLIEDGHTSVSFSKELRDKYKNENAKLPFNIKIRSGKIFISNSQTNNLLKGDEILSINNIKPSEILKLIKYPVADIYQQKVKQIEKYFSYFLFMEYEFTDKLNLQILRNGITENKEVSLLKRAKPKDYNKYRFSVMNDTIGILKIRSFSGINKKNYTEFLDSTFNVISKENITQLIIDLKDNGGGNSYFGEIILPYIAVNKYRFNQKYRIKTSKPEKKYIRKNYIKWYMYPLYPLVCFSKMGRILLCKKNGTITNLKIKDEHLSPVENAFKGNVSVLTSNTTYSAAADFVVAFKYVNRGNIVGDTIGQPYSGFIDKILVTLPNSKISGGVSFKQYEYIGCTDKNKNQGVAPDIFIDVNRFRDEKKLYEIVIKKVNLRNH